MKKNKLKMLDLFSGIGTFSYAFEKTQGFETVAFCEWDEHARKVLGKHWPKTPKFSDIRDVHYTHIYAGEGYLQQHNKETGLPEVEVFGADIDVIVGGSPCTDLSVAGKKKGFVDEEGNTTRSGLWFEYKRIIKEVRPRWVVIENVRNMLNLGFATVLQDLHELGYACEWQIISARSVGAPHLRERIWIVAYPNRYVLRKLSERGAIGRNELQASREAFLGDTGSDGEAILADPDHFRFWPAFASEEEKSQWWAVTAAEYRNWWKTLPETRGVYDGPTDRLHERHRKQRIKQLGNGIVAPIAEIMAKRILETEGGW